MARDFELREVSFDFINPGQNRRNHSSIEGMATFLKGTRFIFKPRIEAEVPGADWKDISVASVQIIGEGIRHWTRSPKIVDALVRNSKVIVPDDFLTLYASLTGHNPGHSTMLEVLDAMMRSEGAALADDVRRITENVVREELT
jgi:hypothetical protein